MFYNQDTSYQSYSFKKIINPTQSDTALQRIDPNLQIIRKESKPSYPIPKGDSAYSKAKRAEYIDKNLKIAEKYYKIAIETGDRAESAIKDLAGVMHQQGKTIEAIDFLKLHRNLFIQDPSKYENLLINLRRQIIQKGNRLNKFLKISGLPQSAKKNTVINLFSKPERIQAVDIYEDNIGVYAIVKFSSHSAARKTLESFVHFDSFKVEWFSISGDVGGDVLSTKIEFKKDKPAFMSKIFSRDHINKDYVMPLSEPESDFIYEISIKEAENLLSNDLINML